jgi:hypothetical protein
MPIPPENLPPYYMQGNAINNRVTHTDRPWLVLVNQADPNFARDQHHEIEYEFLRPPVLCRSQQARRVRGLLKQHRRHGEEPRSGHPIALARWGPRKRGVSNHGSKRGRVHPSRRAASRRSSG